jgi:hypothetical protein
MKVIIQYNNTGFTGFYCGQTLSTENTGYKRCTHGHQLVEVWQKKQSCYLLRGELTPVTWKVL